MEEREATAEVAGRAVAQQHYDGCDLYIGKEKSRSFGLWLLIWRFGPEENDGCQSDQSHKTQRAFLSTEHSSCICAWHLGAVGVFSAYGHLQLPGGPALQPLVAGLGMVSFYFGASLGLLACSMAAALD